MQNHKVLISSHHETPLGTIIIIANNTAVYLVQFADNQDTSIKINKLLKSSRAQVQPGTTHVIDTLKHELNAYFAGTLTSFSTPFAFVGTDFSVHVWQALQSIPYQHTISYRELATATGNSRAYRAVARANAVNPLAIVIPCHRVIHANGNFGGYNGGIERKAWLINHEASSDVTARE